MHISLENDNLNMFQMNATVHSNTNEAIFYRLFNCKAIDIFISIPSADISLAIHQI